MRTSTTKAAGQLVAGHPSAHAATEHSDWQLGYSSGPIPNLRPGEVVRPAMVLGRPPMVFLDSPKEGLLARWGEAMRWIWVLLAALVWIGVPVYALFAATHEAILGP